jgi:hypothetical protein
MFPPQYAQKPSTPDFSSFAEKMRRLGETFTVRDAMVPSANIVWVPLGDTLKAAALVQSERFSVVPESENGVDYPRVFCTVRIPDRNCVITEERPTTISDHIPDSTPLAEAFFLFDEREWYLTLRGNQVSGLITYWEFNRHVFRVQLFTMVSLIEWVSRDILARDGCGTADPTGIDLDSEALAIPLQRFEAAKQVAGGNRFVDELDFHQVHEALKAHEPWRKFLLGRNISKKQYEKHFSFTTIRNDVMHGRTIFPTYERFKRRRRAIEKMIEWIDLLCDYRAGQV